ncbi:hypothetical protein HPB50_010735 [Hyalomma asiaticum]|uniref:Uncharacterized protein n=1 Tax=Hyalomma asiaticum TaxID=266040 RepID=A0ACB7S1X1_HYAAI|nr:hypothetical protein HPB50_010735 [Hyalomma asiaticum]
MCRHRKFGHSSLLIPLLRRDDPEFYFEFLASGDTQRSLSFSFMIGRSTVSEVISETTQVIWDTLNERYVKCPRKPEEWRDIARGFEQRWNFPNCIGYFPVVVQESVRSDQFDQRFGVKTPFTTIDVGHFGTAQTHFATRRVAQARVKRGR